MKDSLIKINFNLPKEWEVQKLELLTHKIIDGTHHTPHYTDSGIPFLRVTDVQTKDINFDKLKFVSKEEHQFLIKRCNPEKGDLLYSKNGTIGIPKIVDWDWEFSIFVSLALIKPIHTLIDAQYLKHFLNSEITKWQIKRRAKQGTVTNLHLEEIREFEIVVHGLSKQRKIAHILTTLDEVIEHTETAIAKYQTLKEGLMQDLFSRGIDTNTGKLRPAREEAPELYKATSLGWVPKDWGFSTLNQLCDLIVDCKNRTSPFVDKSDYPVIRTSNIKNGKLVWNDMKYTDSVSYVIWTQRAIPTPGDVIITREAPLGQPLKIPKGITPILGQRTLMYRPNEEKLNADFLVYTILTDTMQTYLHNISSGSTVHHLKVGEMKEIRINHPINIVEQNAIADRLNQVSNQIDTLVTEKDKLTIIKQGLMQDLLTGKVSVEAAESIIEKTI